MELLRSYQLIDDLISFTISLATICNRAILIELNVQRMLIKHFQNLAQFRYRLCVHYEVSVAILF